MRIKEDIPRKINRLNQTNLSTFNLHQQTFPRFKDINNGKNVYLIAPGSSAAKFNHVKSKNDVYVGVNRSFELPHEMDFMFIQDYSGKTKEYIDKLDKYRVDECTKFYGLTTEFDYETERTIPEKYTKMSNVLRYRTDWAPIDGYFIPQFAYDITTQPLGCFGSITFPALQFIMYTHPKKVYLVGCDCTTDGYAHDKNYKNYLIPEHLIKAYQEFKKFANKYYPDVEIISINPVGLKGIFQDEIR